MQNINGITILFFLVGIFYLWKANSWRIKAKQVDKYKDIYVPNLKEIKKQNRWSWLYGNN